MEINGGASPVIRLRRLTKRFDGVSAVDGVSLDVQANELFALLGPSGCGKTTLLRMIAGFEVPDEGEIFLRGQDITGMRPSRRPINMMFQSYALFPHMSVYKNIAYGLEVEGLAAAEIERRVGEMMNMTQLTPFSHRKPARLSGGQKQRVALARSLVKRPCVLLLDEPLGSLDKKLREQMQRELKRIQHQSGITFIFVTHDQEEALSMADRIALLNQGKIVQVGTPQSLYEHPNCRFAADFIGVMNFFEGGVEGDGVRINGGVFLRGAIPAGIVNGARANMAVRPERVTLSVEPPAKDVNRLKGRISNITYYGQELSVRVQVKGLPECLYARLSCAAEQAGSLRKGQLVWCGWETKHCRILDQ